MTTMSMITKNADFSEKLHKKTKIKSI